MRLPLVILACSAAALVAGPALAQTDPPVFRPSQPVGEGNPQPTSVRCWMGTAWKTCPTGAKQEAFTLVSANLVAVPVVVYGGNYVVSQSCSTYGTVTIRYRGPDGATMTAMLTRTVADSTGGTLVALGSGAVVDATVSNATGCNVQLARVP